MSEPRIIKYRSDELIAQGKYHEAVFECLKESGAIPPSNSRQNTRIKLVKPIS